jgi:2-methylcitrate dehydratase
VRICRDLALAAQGNATVIGTTRRSTPELASFANGVAFRYYDLNDAYVGGLSGHPSDNIAPCLAVAEAEGASVADLITAIFLVYEITCRLIDACDVMSRGWGAPVFSLPAVALAAGKLMKLPPGKLTQAVNLALNDHIPMGQTRMQTLSDWRGSRTRKRGATRSLPPCWRAPALPARRRSLRAPGVSSSWCRDRPTSMLAPSAGGTRRFASIAAA